MRGVLPCVDAISHAALICGLGLAAAPAFAQDGTPPAISQAVEGTVSADMTASEALLGDIIVTGTKQSRAQANQTVAVAITAFGAEQIDALNIGDFTQIASQVPGVSFEQTTQRSTVNFSIRGLGVNSSKTSTAPAVGTFVNGVYMGVNTGIFFDTFDVAGIEVLRGPQGTLFGRNVTGGAVLLNYKKPQSAPDLVVRGRLESGPTYNLAAAGGGALTDNVFARVAAFYEHDLGYFDAPLLGDDHYGEAKSFVIRPSLRFENGSTDITLFAEYGRVTGDGPPSFAPDYRGATSTTVPGTQQEPGRRYNDLLVSFRGETFIEFYSATLDARQEVGFGEDAAITSVTGYRNLQSFANTDLDATPLERPT
jgi:iron complex outermembrane receptor protein